VDAREDFDSLLDFLLPFAAEMLGKHDEFFPFAAAVSRDGEVTAVGVEHEDDQPTSNGVIEALAGLLRDMAARGEIRASGICSDAIVESPETGRTDAARVALEHAEAEPVAVYLPYSKEPDGYAFGELVAVQDEPRVFEP
jgi:hypothetical protein